MPQMGGFLAPLLQNLNTSTYGPNGTGMGVPGNTNTGFTGMGTAPNTGILKGDGMPWNPRNTESPSGSRGPGMWGNLIGQVGRSLNPQPIQPEERPPASIDVNAGQRSPGGERLLPSPYQNPSGQGGGEIGGSRSFRPDVFSLKRRLGTTPEGQIATPAGRTYRRPRPGIGGMIFNG